RPDHRYRRAACGLSSLVVQRPTVEHRAAASPERRGRQPGPHGWEARRAAGPYSKLMKAMILAAGEGTRLVPLTEHRPKPILPLLEQPLLTHTFRLLRQFGIDEAVVNLHHRAARIVEALGDGSRWGIRLTYSEEERLLGTAGGVKQAERYFDGPFLVLY